MTMNNVPSFFLRALVAFLRGGWRIVGGRAALRLIWENSQHPQMPCVISTRNGWVLGQKEFRKVLPLSHNVQKQLDWDFMECANPRLGCSVWTKETIANAAENPKHQVIREFGVLLAVWLFCPPPVHRHRKLRTENASLLEKPPMASPDLGTGKKCRILATYLSPIRMWCRRRLDGKRSDSWEKPVKSGGRRHFFRGEVETKGKAASEVGRWINHLRLAAA